VLVQAKPDKHAALGLMRKLLKKYGFVPDQLITDDLRSNGAAAYDLGIEKHHERGRWRSNRAENSHQPPDDANARWRASKAEDQFNVFSLPMQPFTTPSTSNVI
jgi:transposase-like protein